MSRPWITGRGQEWDVGQPLELDAHGWVKSLAPGQIARTLLFWNGDYPGGEYVVLFEGEGELEYFQNREVIEKSPGRHVIRLDPKKGGLGIFITKTNPENHLRNIRVVPRGSVCEHDGRSACTADADCKSSRCLDYETHHDKLIFHPQFLASLEPYGVVRFINWMRANDTTLERWEDRPKLDDARWTSKGVPVEVMVALANRAELDPWFCLPHTANEDYVRGFATYVRDQLDKSRRLYVEHSNEVWNGLFPQHRYAADQVAKEPRRYASDRFEAQMQWHSRRTVWMGRIFKSVLGGESSRLIRVMGSWAANSWSSKVLLDFEDAHKEVEALAIAPYFGHALGQPDRKNEVAAMSLDTAFDELRQRSLPETRGWIREAAEVASKFGVRLIAYEGGQHLAGVGAAQGDARINELFDRMNRHPRMRALYLEYLRSWRDEGGELFLHYDNVSGWGRHGRWGARESLTEPVESSPKLQALLLWAQGNPRWW